MFSRAKGDATDGADLLMVPDGKSALERSKQSRIASPTVPVTQGWPDRYAMGGTSPILAMEPFSIAASIYQLSGLLPDRP